MRTIALIIAICACAHIAQSEPYAVDETQCSVDWVSRRGEEPATAFQLSCAQVIAGVRGIVFMIVPDADAKGKTAKLSEWGSVQVGELVTCPAVVLDVSDQRLPRISEISWRFTVCERVSPAATDPLE